MNITTELYNNAITRLPLNGQHILAHQANDDMVVYQAYKPGIANFSVSKQYLGGPDFSYNRMSWIKPGFLWMMYRSGWAEKENQERILAIWVSKMDFENILHQAVFSSFNPLYYSSYEQWKDELALKEVRLQWDPDHDPYGGKIDRRAIQLGLKGTMLKTFIEHIKHIEDITDYVSHQRGFVQDGRLDQLLIPEETIFKPKDELLSNRLGLTL